MTAWAFSSGGRPALWGVASPAFFAGQLEAAHRALRADIPEIPEVPPHTFPAAVGAVTELITAHLIEHGAETLPQLSEAIADLDLTLLMGRELAARLRSGQAPA
jgi:hypothetical protein